MGVILKIALSLAAIYAIYLMARRLGLGGDARIRDAAHADALVRESLVDFSPTDIVVDRAGTGALMRDATGRMLLVRRHGAHFVVSLLDPATLARLDKRFLTLAIPGQNGAEVTLDLGEKAQYWAAAMRHMPRG